MSAKREPIEEQALRIVRSLPIQNRFAERIKDELAAGYSEKSIVQCALYGTWPSEVVGLLRHG